MNFSAIQGLVRFRLGARSDLSVGTGLTSLNQWINAAYREICHTFHFSELEAPNTAQSTSANVDSVAVPSGVYAVLTAYDTTNSRYLQPLAGGWEEYERTRATAPGIPTHWTRFGDALYFRPRPSGVFFLRLGVLNEPSDLINATDEPIIPPVWHDGIVILAARNGWLSLDEIERAQALEAGEWRGFVSRVRTPRALESRTSPSRGLRPGLGVVNRRLGY